MLVIHVCPTFSVKLAITSSMSDVKCFKKYHSSHTPYVRRPVLIYKQRKMKCKLWLHIYVLLNANFFTIGLSLMCIVERTIKCYMNRFYWMLTSWFFFFFFYSNSYQLKHVSFSKPSCTLNQIVFWISLSFYVRYMCWFSSNVKYILEINLWWWASSAFGDWMFKVGNVYCVYTSNVVQECVYNLYWSNELSYCYTSCIFFATLIFCCLKNWVVEINNIYP